MELSLQLRDRLDNLPDQPGVYLLKDTLGQVIYVGKAKSLRSRVAFHFGTAAQLTAHRAGMAALAVDIEHIVTDTDLKAQSLERDLLEQYHPKFNLEWREQPKEERRMQILEAAAVIFAEKGYQRATVKEIAGRAGIAPGTIYLYFGSKREMLSAIVNETETPMVAALLEMGGMGDREAMVEMLEKGLDITEAQLPFNRTLFSEAWVDNGLMEEAITARIKRIHKLLENYIAERIAAGVFRPVDPALAAQLVMGMFGSLIVSAIRGMSPLPSSEKRRALAEAMVDLLLDGIRADA